MISNNQKYLYYLIFFHVALWTIIPTIVNVNLPLDTIEALAWGNELKLGYDKYPPVFPIFTEIFFKIFENNDWAYYLLSQLFVALCFLIIFNFSQYFFKNDIYSLISVMLLECIYFFNYTTPELNAFIPLFPFLALTTFFCWRSINFDKNFDWIMFGVFAGISTLTYYLALYLLASLSIFFIREILINKKVNYKYFYALISYFIILSPHLYFIFENDFKSIEYALFRSFGDPLSGLSSIKLLDHFLYPLIFLLKQILILTPLLILLRLLVTNFRIKINLSDKKLIFLFTIAFLPIILMFLTSFFGGIRVRTMWMTTFYIFPGVFFIYLFKDKIKLERLKRFFFAFLFIFITLPVAYGIQSTFQNNKRTDFPGREIAKKIQIVWDKNFSNKIEIVAGESWVYGGWYAGNLSYYLKDRPVLKYQIDRNNFKTGFIWVDELKNSNFCNGILLEIKPYYEACLIGKK